MKGVISGKLTGFTQAEYALILKLNCSHSIGEANRGVGLGQLEFCKSPNEKDLGI